MDDRTNSKSPLDVIIVGAGIGGLSAAIALRREGHNVKIYESSGLNHEVGAAINVCSNASRILLAWGLDPRKGKFVTAKSTYIAEAESLHRTYENEYSDIEMKYGAPWYFAHRIDFHMELKRLATSEVGPGKPATLFLASRVIAYDAETGSVTLADNTTHAADLIVAADGVHSDATQAVLGFRNPALPTDQSIYRFLIPSSDIAADPDTAHFLDGDDGRFKVIIGKGPKRLVWYPCRNNEVQNFVGFVHGQEKDAHEDWHAPVDIGDLLSDFSEFHPSILAVLKKATDIKKWPLLYRDPIPSWHKSKLVLIGDAAHPMLPYQGQAGAQAIEDSGALGTMLSNLTKTNTHDILPLRLHLFEQVRIKRASAMQIFSNAGQEDPERIIEAAKPYVDGKIPRNPAEFIAYNFGYDVLKDSQKVLQESGSGG